MTRRMRVDDLTDLAIPAQPVLAPDDARIVYELRTQDMATDREVKRLWSVGMAGEDPRQLTYGHDDTAPAWAPDGTTLAFLRADDESPQVHLLPVHGGEPEQVTRLPLGAGAPVWSPDGGWLAFDAPVDRHAMAEEDDQGAHDRRAAAPVVIDRLDYQADGCGLLGTIGTQVHVLELATGSVRQLTHGIDQAHGPVWSPDGATLAFIAGVGTDNDLTNRAAVHVVDATDPTSRPRQVALVDGVASAVTWTADGAALIVVGWPGDPVGHARLLRVPLDGGRPVDLAGALDRNVMPGAIAYPGARPELTDDGETVLFCLRDRGCTHLYAVAVEGGEPRLVIGGDGRVVSGLSVVDGTAAVALTTPTSFGEILTVDLATGAETVRTRHGAKLADVTPFVRQEREFTIDDGTVVQGWLLTDPDTSGPRPLLLDVHGGPHNAWNASADEMHLYHQELVARGWAVLLVNPRGSDGYGEDFYTAVHGAWGKADSQDFLQPVDQLVDEGLADPERLAIAGYSYGGFMAAYLTGRDDRFAAAVAGGVVSDLVSMGGTCDDARFLSSYELDGAPWQDPIRYARLSPLTEVLRVTTPTLVVHGQEDRTCPVGQAQQWFTALRERGVPTRMVLYPGAGHAFIFNGRPSHRLDFNRRIVDWVEHYTGQHREGRRASLDAAHWTRRLADLAARHDVPGAQLGILRVRPDADDEVIETAHGVLNMRTGAQATTDSLFQIGSVTKVWTATVVMQLVDEGLIALDDPVVEVLPELRLSAPDVTKQVTLRHLLTHTSGIDGDIMTDTGRGDDCLERYVELLAEAGQNHPLGSTWSYCNSGFVLLGRVIERLTDSTWDEAMRERLLTPLGLTRTVTLPEEALLHTAAVGHMDQDGERQPTPKWTLPRALGPAGLITSTPADVLAFARMHLVGGTAPDGTRLLAEEAVTAMADFQADLPDSHTLGDSWGLGWIRYLWDGHRIIGHDGATLGQAAFLRLIPQKGLAVTLHTNGGNARDLYQELFREVFAELAHMEMPPGLTPPAQPVSVDVSPYLGTYERASVRMEVFADGAGGPRLRTTVTGPLAEVLPDPTQEYPMVPVSPGLFVVRPPAQKTWSPVTFYSLPTGEHYLHFGARATPRVG